MARADGGRDGSVVSKAGSDGRRWALGRRNRRFLVAVAVTVVTVIPAGPRAVAAAGLGQMTITPATTIAGSSGNKLTLAYTAPASSSLSGRVSVVIPSRWTRPQQSSSTQPGFLSIQQGTCATVSFSSLTDTSGKGIGPWKAIATVKCAAGKSFSFRYAGGGSAVTAPTVTGGYEFTSAAGVGTGALSSLAVQPVEAVAPAATRSLVVTTPSQVATGTVFTVLVTAEDAYRNTTPAYRGTVRLSSTDAAATLPAAYAFTATDRGVHSYVVALATAGGRSITAADVLVPSVTGTSPAIAVSSATAPPGPTEEHARGLVMPVADPGRLTGDFFAGGVLYLADYDHRTGLFGRILSYSEATGTTQVLSPSAGRPTDVVTDSSGHLFFAEHVSGTIYTLAGGVATGFVSGFHRPQNLALDPDNTTLYVSDATSDDLNNKIYAIDLSTQAVTTVAGTGARSGARVCDAVARPATTATVNKPLGIAVYGHWLYIASQFDDLVYRVDLTSGLLTRYAGTCTTTQVGDHGPATGAYVQKPQGIDVDGVGNLYIVQYNGAVRRVDAVSGQITTVFTLSPKAGSNADLSFDPVDGSLWLSAQGSTASVLVKIVKT